MSGSNPVLHFYQSVISNVLTNVKDLFINEGLDEQILVELDQSWRAKLGASKAVTGHTRERRHYLNQYYQLQAQATFSNNSSTAPIRGPANSILMPVVMTSEQSLASNPYAIHNLIGQPHGMPNQAGYSSTNESTPSKRMAMNPSQVEKDYGTNHSLSLQKFEHPYRDSATIVEKFSINFINVKNIVNFAFYGRFNHMGAPAENNSTSLEEAGNFSVGVYEITENFVITPIDGMADVIIQLIKHRKLFHKTLQNQHTFSRKVTSGNKVNFGCIPEKWYSEPEIK
ncbi:transcription initiation factor IIA subunit 1-like [Octopus sinensis]|uniref:Transcription initiation factor IIA subunit 1-like n=1 Tax=Octopus sinensis TaxID=2607531 RepID=A0A6P7U8Z7_9MOLL|nr:transcription initiation factor IIA subunit 1-like [Octopus sinensis]